MEKVDLRNLIFFRIGVRVVFHEALGGIFLCQRNGDDIAVAVLIVGNRGVQTGIGQVFRNLFGSPNVRRKISSSSSVSAVIWA